MKKYLFGIFIVMFIIIEIILSAFNYMDKYEISKILEIDNINDFSVRELKGLSNYGSSKFVFIKFRISSDKYEKYNLKYEDLDLNLAIYEGEITNKKKKISDNYYMCYYEKVIYNENEIEKFRKMKNNRFFLEINTIIVILLIFIYSIKMIKDIINRKLDNKISNTMENIDE